LPRPGAGERGARRGPAAGGTKSGALIGEAIIIINPALQSVFRGFYVWSKADAGHSVIRLVTSWATPAERVAEFIADVQAARAA